MTHRKFGKLFLILILLLAALPGQMAQAQSPAAGAWPVYFDMVLDEARGVIYASDTEAHKIDVISMTSLQLVTSFQLQTGARPFGIALSPDGSELAIAQFWRGDNDGSLLFINPVSGATIANMVFSISSPVDWVLSPFDVIYGRDGRLYCADVSIYSDNVHVIDTATHTVVAVNNEIYLEYPRLALSADKNWLYISSETKISKYDVSGDTPPAPTIINLGVYSLLQNFLLSADESKIFTGFNVWSNPPSLADSVKLGTYSGSSTQLELPSRGQIMAIINGGTPKLKFFNTTTYAYEGMITLTGTTWLGPALLDSTAKKIFLSTDAGVKLLMVANLTPSLLVDVPNMLEDGSFEKSLGTTQYWYQSSKVFQTPLCTLAICGNGGGMAGPRSGNVWAWFGGIQAVESGYVSQYVLLPKGPDTLRFYLWIQAPMAQNYAEDRLSVVITNGITDTTIFTADATEAAQYSKYKLVALDVSDYASDINYVRVSIAYSINGRYVNFNVDDVSINQATFGDVAPDYWAWSPVEILARNGVTGGCANSPRMYCPLNWVTRSEMAVFLLRGIHGSGYTPPAASGTLFTDVPASHWAAAWIEQLANEGITSGCGVGLYCPESPVYRDQMAVFLLRAMHGVAFAPPAASGKFADVPLEYWDAAWIEQLAAEGITSGCSAGNYCPANPVTRDQMAVFLVRAFGLK